MIKFYPMTEPAEWNWFTERTKATRSSDTQGIVAYDAMGKILAVTVFDTFTVDSCCVHLAIDNPFVIRSGFLNVLCKHAFWTCNRDRMFASIIDTNHKSLKFVSHAGFREITRIEDGYAKGVDFVIMRMDKEGCRWLEGDNQSEKAA